MRERILVAEKDCQFCQGRATLRDSYDLRNILSASGVVRLLVVGGGPGTHGELTALMGSSPRVDIVDGTRRADPKRVRALARGADIIVIWGSTILPHAVSNLVKHPAFASKTVTVARRGVSALLVGTREHCARRKTLGFGSTKGVDDV